MARLVNQHILIKPSSFRFLRKHSKATETSVSKIVRMLIENYQADMEDAEKKATANKGQKSAGNQPDH